MRVAVEFSEFKYRDGYLSWGDLQIVQSRCLLNLYEMLAAGTG
jgi:hypothetical protein|eukprot:COSAG01_NODE_6352_length_3718_cov_113.601824_2_plen_43_part_00